jgi:peptidoglycan/LPS O-acetylase OafA/YrhL
LGVEMQFYLIFPFIYIVIYKKKFLLGITLIMLLSLSFWSSIAIENSFYNPVIRFWEFLFGALVYLMSMNERYNNFTKLNLAILRRTLFVLLFVVLFTPISLQRLIATLTPLSLQSLELVTVLLTAWILFLPEDNGVGSNNLLKGIGDSSYSIYLYHFPVIAIMDLYFGRSLLTQLTKFGMTMLLGVTSYIIIEKNFRYKDTSTLTKYWNNTYWRLSSISILMAGIVTMTGLGYDLITQFRPAKVDFVEEGHKESYYDIEGFKSSYCGNGWGLSDDSMEVSLQKCSLDTGSSGGRVYLLGDSFAQHYVPAIQDRKSVV